MNDRRNITITLALFIAALAVALVAAAIPAYAGTWLQQYGKQGECAEGWGTSWAYWYNGPVCTREVDDPSQPVAAPTPTGPPSLSGQWLLYAGGFLVNQYSPGGSTGYTYISTPFAVCQWSNARIYPAQADVDVYALNPNAWVLIRNLSTGPRTINVQVQCD